MSPGYRLPGQVTKMFFRADFDRISSAENLIQNLAPGIENPFEGLLFRKIAAERDIVPEQQNDGQEQLRIYEGGGNATMAIERVLNTQVQDSRLVEETLLNDLNEIMRPDARFDRIDVQRPTGSSNWSVFLDEAGKGRVSLVDSGSGLKTILLVLVNLLLAPVLEHRSLADYVFAFEELENNLHPGLQRRLLRYIAEKAKPDGPTFFITTHSPVIIDLFARNEEAQIIHVVHDGISAYVDAIEGQKSAFEVLEDLDARASDILQANGVVWVEGVSDRIYVARWLDLLCETCEIRAPIQGMEYVFVEYGGKCLSHYNFSSIDDDACARRDLEMLIPALRVCRNHFVIMDSDKKGGTSKINTTKARVVEEADDGRVESPVSVAEHAC